MGKNITAELFEHIDGLCSYYKLFKSDKEIEEDNI